MESLSFSYPGWFIIICVLVGIAFAVALYFRDQKFRDISKILGYGLALIRFLAITSICLLLLGPLLKSIKTNTQDPIIVLAQDVSQSISEAMDSLELDSYRSEFKKLESGLAENYEVKSLAFGEQVRAMNDTIRFNDKVSNFSQLFQYIEDQYGNQNLGAVFISSDGIFNEGRNPAYSNFKFKAPVYLVALGDTVPRKDLNIRRIYHNNIAYLNDKFAIQLDIDAINCKNSRSTINIYREDDGRFRKLADERININTNDFFQSFEFVLDAQQSGLNRYRISLNEVAGEISSSNNLKDFYIEVLDARLKILILGHGAHPDLAALKQMLSKNINYEITTELMADFNANPLDFDFIIFHNLPSRSHSIQNILQQIENKKTPRFFIPGSETDLNSFNSAQKLIEIIGSNGIHNEVQAKFQDNFGAFTIQEQVIPEIENYPPLFAPFGEYTLGAKTRVLLTQQISGIETEYPLLCFAETDGIKAGVLAAEGIWKWKMFNYLEHENAEYVEELIGKSIQYVSVKEDKRKFRAKADKNLFKENEHIHFVAELYNNSYERINEPDVFLQITNSQGEEFPFTFSKRDSYYELDAGLFPEDSYRYTARVKFNGQDLEHKGRFSVQSIQLEMYDLTARHDVLKNISDKFGDGKVYYAENTNQLADHLLESDNLKPVVYQSSQTKPIIDLKWIFAVLVFLLGLEWFLRRYYGAY